MLRSAKKSLFSMALSCWIIGRETVCLILAVVGFSVSVYLWRMPEPVRQD